MRKRTLLITAASAIIYLTTTSYKSGPASLNQGNLTGSPGRSGCGSCHGGGAGSTTGSIELRDKDAGAGSAPITSYTAGKTYIVTLRGSNASLSHFGFQLVTLDQSNAYKGTYTGFPANVHGFPTTGNVNIVEHSTALAKNGSGNYEVSFDWTAPAATSGPLTMYAMINAVNNNNANTGDVASPTLSLTLADKTSVNNVQGNLAFRVYPNPVQDVLTLDLDNATSGTYEVVAYNAAGAVMSNSVMQVVNGTNKSSLNTSNWPSGMYFVQLSKDGNTQVVPVVK